MKPLRQMKTKKRTEVTLEVDEVLVLRHVKRIPQAWCDHCNRQVRLVTPEEAATLTGASPRSIYRRIEARELHFRETSVGQLDICLNSLFQEAEAKRRLDFLMTQHERRDS
jgi:hypothetical protein